MARSSEAIKTWAEAVERAAYAGEAVDAGGEAAVDRLAPGDAATPRGGGRDGGRGDGNVSTNGESGAGPAAPPGTRRPVGGPRAR
jgi:hypothetical protein